jgi:hypothetical protein
MTTAYIFGVILLEARELADLFGDDRRLKDGVSTLVPWRKSAS